MSPKKVSCNASKISDFNILQYTLKTLRWWTKNNITFLRYQVSTKDRINFKLLTQRLFKYSVSV